jgi:hypothetical protein
MGNADFKANIPYYKQLSEKHSGHFVFLDSGEFVEISPHFHLFGYSFIPFSGK